MINNYCCSLKYSKVLLLASLTFFSSCQKESDVISNEEKSLPVGNYIDFMGKKVYKPLGIDEKVFSQIPNEFLNYSVQKYFGSPSGRTLSNVLASTTFDQIADIAVEEDKKYPDLSQYPLLTADLERIKHDLPFIENEEQVRQNTEIVYEYYESLLRNDVVKKLATGSKISAGSRTLIDYGNANDLEKKIAVANPRLGEAARFAKGESEGQTVARYGPGAHLQNDTKANAFKHAMWNSLTIHKCIALGKSKYGAINDTRDITTAHEYIVNGVNSNGGIKMFQDVNGDENFDYWFEPSLAHAMDLHNNCLGRNFMEENVKWGIFGLRNQPGYSEMADRFQQYLNQPSTFQATHESQILVMYGNDWSNLANMTNAWTYNNANRDKMTYIN